MHLQGKFLRVSRRVHGEMWLRIGEIRDLRGLKNEGDAAIAGGLRGKHSYSSQQNGRDLLLLLALQQRVQ